jgi:tetratricopeptide (TPR) repeat protein
MAREGIICFFLLLATLIVFSPVYHHDFVHLDDDLYITENPNVQQGFSGESIKWAFTSTHAGLWIPLTWLSLMLDFEFFGLKAGGYHLSNLFFHLANTILLFLILKRMTGGLWRSAFVAALFALHPLRVESVAWAVERKDVLSTLFFLFSLNSYVRYTEHGRSLAYVSALLLFLLSLMAKPMLVTMPCLLLLIDYWPLGRLNFREPGSDDYQKKTAFYPSKKEPTFFLLLREKIPFFVLSLIFSVVTLLAQKSFGALGSFQTLPLRVRLTNALLSYVEYIEKMIWPRHLAVLYPHPGETLSMWKAVIAGLLLAGLTGFVLWAARRRYRYLLTGWFWYLLSLLPVIGLVQAGPQAIADRFTYVPLIGLFLMVSWSVPDLMGNWRPKRLLLPISAGLVLSLLMVGTWSQVKHWRNSITLFEHTLRVTDNNSPIHNNLGIVFLKQGRFSDAVPHFTKALQIRPNDVRAHLNLAVSLAHVGDLQQAIEHYIKALELEPHHAGAHNNLGNVLLLQGRVDEAAAEFSRALEINGHYAEAHNNLGVVLARQGRLPEAIDHFREALRVNPDYQQARRNLDRALGQVEKGKTAGTN